MSDLGSNLGGLAQNLVSGALQQAQARVPITLASNATSSSTASDTTANSAQLAKIDKVSHQFEAVFMRQMLAQARKSDMGDTMFSSDAMNTFGSMEDSKFADIAAGKDTLGIAKMLEKTLSHRMGLDSTGAATGATSGATSAAATSSGTSNTSTS